jgi:lipid-A-disaccharide synthase
MECSLIGTPFLIFYRTYPLNYYLLKPMVKISNIGIINILAKKEIIKEFIQKDFNKESLYNEAKKILTDKEYREKMKNGLKTVWDILGSDDASFNTAKIINQFALR